MASPDQLVVPPTFITLGPEGTDHENATRYYLGCLGLLDEAEISLVGNLVDDGKDRVRTEPNSMLVQCAAHQQVNELNMNPGEIFMVDTFMHPTMELALVVRNDVEVPRHLGIMPACAGYVDLADWEKITNDVGSKPVVTQGLLAGEYDAGVTFAQDARDNADVLHVAQSLGENMTSWVVFAGRPGPEPHQGLVDRQEIRDFYLNP